jgi:tRNA 2-thiouridine synthesizing protein C
VVITSGPYAGTRARDAIEAAMTCAVFGQSVSVLLIRDAVLCLTARPPKGSGLRDLSAMLDALPHYDVQRVGACNSSLADRGIVPPEGILTLDTDALVAWIRAHDRHLGF